MAVPGGAFVGFREFNVSGLYLGSEVVLAVQVAFMVNRQRIWKRDFDHTIRALVEAGWVKKFMADYNPNTELSKQSPTAVAPLTYSHIKSTMAFFAAGAVVASIVFVAELYIAQMTTWRNRTLFSNDIIN